MLGFGFDIPAGDLGYQMRVEVHVIGEVRYTFLTPQLKPPPIVIRRIEKPQVVEVYFDFDSAELKESEKRKLLQVKGKVKVEGYASPEGSSEYNLKLSERRARNVAEFLKKRGAEVLEIKGLGEKSCSLPPEKWSLCRKSVVKPSGGR
ncbi:MAG TPA: OmpA family protein [Aquifex aeolicus]|uniref:OmpA family protein n=1 Tax=Aquifex aeolicus TaxID=63363 RepID=A0A7C5QDG0_AQUAO|nr:OmpA family protein [Aquifex aeolicus]